MDLKKLFAKVFGYMAMGLIISFATAYIVSNNETMLTNIFTTSLYYFIFIAELVVVIFLSARAHKMHKITAITCFVLYSILTGLTLSIIFIAFKLSSIILVFLVTAVLFIILSLIGYKTNVDLTKIGVYLLVGLVGVVLVSLLNIFLGNSTLDLVISVITVIIFIGFVIYDVQKIKGLSDYVEEDNLAIIGALELYLDFINIFLNLLSILNRND